MCCLYFSCLPVTAYTRQMLLRVNRGFHWWFIVFEQWLFFKACEAKMLRLKYSCSFLRHANRNSFYVSVLLCYNEAYFTASSWIFVFLQNPWLFIICCMKTLIHLLYSKDISFKIDVNTTNITIVSDLIDTHQQL